MKDAIKSGVYVGLMLIIINVIIYIIDAALFAKWWVGISLIILVIVLVIYFGLQYRKEAEGGYLSFKEAYLHGLVTFIVAGVLGAIYNLILFNIIDPNLSTLLTDAIVDQSYAMMKNFGAPEEQIDKAIAQIKEDTPARFTLVGQLKGFGWNIVGALVVSLITGAIVKKKKPEII